MAELRKETRRNISFKPDLLSFWGFFSRVATPEKNLQLAINNHHIDY